MSPSWGLITAITEPMFIEQDNDHLGAMLRPCTIIVLMGQRKAPADGMLHRTWDFYYGLLLAWLLVESLRLFKAG